MGNTDWEGNCEKYSEQTMEAFGDDLGVFIGKFEACEDLESQLVMFHEKEEISNFVKEHLDIILDTKDDELANRLKDEGNKLFLKSQDVSALLKYNEALFNASKSGPTLSLVLANRSAVFYKQGKFDLCEKDIQMALELNYPSKMKYKLLDRRAKCYYNLGKWKEMVQYIETVKQLLNSDSDLPTEKADKILADLNHLIKSKAKQKPVKNSRRPKTSCDTVNEKFSGFSAALEMKSSPERGRFMVANRDITVGEILGAEDPVVGSLLPSWSDQLCTVCFRTSEDAPLPCLSCSEARFCSVECWKEGKEGSHDLMCGVSGDIGELLKQVKGSESCPEYYRLCVMVMGRYSAADIVEIMESVESRKELNMTEVPVQKEADLRSLFNLVSNDQDRNMKTDFWIFLAVIYFLDVLEQKNKFTDLNKSSGLSNQQTKIGLLMLKTLRILQFNTHSVLQSVRKSDTCDEGFSMEPIGSAIYNSMAFLNHSCNPNTIKYWEGRRMVLVACQLIRKGQEVTDNYGMHFTATNRNLRRSWLQEFFWFPCSCTACTLNLSTTELLPEQIQTVVCPDNDCRQTMNLRSGTWSCTCGKERSEVQVTAMVAELVRKVMETIQMEAMTGGFPLAVKSYSNILTALYSVVAHPWRGLVMPEQMLWKAIRMVRGNRRCQE